MTVAFLLVGIAAAPGESLQLAMSLPGAAAGIAILAGFGPRGALSIKPWIFTAVSVLAYTGALLVVDGQKSAFLLNLLGLMSLAGAAGAAFTQRTMASISDRVEVQHRRHVHRTRWGAACVAAGVALALLSLRAVTIISPPDSTRTSASHTSAPNSIAHAPYLPPVMVGRIAEPLVTEISGLIASRSAEDVFWVHNDSGDGPWLYCLRGSGASCGRWTVTGAAAFDWEAIAATGSQGHGTLYIGDIGDNDALRAGVTIYEVPEPELSGATEEEPQRTSPARRIDLRYPNRPLDAEAMLVHPRTGDLYIMAKAEGSQASVYKAEHPLRSNAALTHIGTNELFGLFVDRTALDVAPDGHRVVMATYGGIYELVREPGEHFDQIWGNEPAVVDDSVQAQVEAVAYGSDGRTIFFTEERQQPRLWMSERY